MLLLAVARSAEAIRHDLRAAPADPKARRGAADAADAIRTILAPPGAAADTPRGGSRRLADLW